MNIFKYFKRTPYITKKVKGKPIKIETDDERLAACIAECLETDSFVFHSYDENGNRIIDEEASE